MIKGTIIALCLALLVGCSNNPAQPEANLGQAHDAALVGAWWYGLDTITFSSSGEYTRTVIYTPVRTLERGTWYTFYGTLYMQRANGEQYKFEYDLDTPVRAYFCKYSYSSINAPLSCDAYKKL
jgi:hypothetical protein